MRRQGTGYELVAGERRLRAATMAGLREVPCLVAQVGEEDSALLALMENLQRRDLDCWEEAEALSRLIARYGLSQEETARRLLLPTSCGCCGCRTPCGSFCRKTA